MHAGKHEGADIQGQKDCLKSAEPHRESELSEDKPPVVSVVIPSYNSARHIRRCLRALFNQRTDLPFEVILVDSSDDGADQITAAEYPQVRIFHFNERCLVGTARNIGFERARGEVVLILDSDCIANPSWIDQMYYGIKKLNADGVGGSLENGTPWSLSGCLQYYLEFFRALPCKAKPYESPYLIGGNCGFRRNVFEIARYTDPPTADDWIFNWELLSKGKILYFLPMASVTHLNKTGLKRVFHYQYRLGLGACVYRSMVSPDDVRIFRQFPFLAFLIPAVIVPRIGGLVLIRRGIFEFFKFVLLLPMLWVANTVWAAGFYRELMNQKSGKPTPY
jgi:glycosyltransferase involved in cell wall biosynthesis